MKIYTVHTKESDPNPLETAIFIKKGFSWLGAIFHVFWTLYHKMWFASIILFFVVMILQIIQTKNYIDSAISDSAQIGFFLLIGFGFNDWYRLTIEKKGYVLYDVISAQNEDEARYKFMNDMLQRTTFGSSQGLPGLV